MIPQSAESAGLTKEIAFSGSTFLGYSIAAIVSVLLPAAAYLLMRKYRAARLYSVIVGIITYFLAVKFCDFCVLILFSSASPALQTALAVIFVGFFEETGRWLAMKYPLTDIRKDSHAVCYGIGHAGAECLMRGIQSFRIIRIGQMLNSGGTEPFLSGKTAEQAKTVLQQLQAFADRNLFVSFTDCLNSAVNFCFHIALSLLIFRKIGDAKFLTRWLPSAILIHVLFNGLYSDAAYIGGIAFANITCILTGLGITAAVSKIINGKALIENILYPVHEEGTDQAQ